MKYFKLILVFTLVFSLGYSLEEEVKDVSEGQLMNMLKLAKPKNVNQKIIYKYVKEKSTSKAKPSTQKATTKTIAPLNRDYSAAKRVDFSKKARNLRILDGTMLNVVLANDVYSFNTETPVLAELMEDYKYNGLFIPKGALFVGNSRTTRIGDKRIDIHFHKLVVKDEKSIKDVYQINGRAVQEGGELGLVGDERREVGNNFIDAVSIGLIPFIGDVISAVFMGGDGSDVTLSMDQANLEPSYEYSLNITKGSAFRVLFMDDNVTKR
jgi:hypothetical protein